MWTWEGEKMVSILDNTKTQMGSNHELFKFTILCMKSVLLIRDPGREIILMRSPRSGMGKIRIRDKHLGSATLIARVSKPILTTTKNVVFFNFFLFVGAASPLMKKENQVTGWWFSPWELSLDLSPCLHLFILWDYWQRPFNAVITIVYKFRGFFPGKTLRLRIYDL